jgi:hypothetical protein
VSSAQDQPAGTTDSPSATTAGTGAVPGQRATQEGYQEQQPEYGRPEDRGEDRGEDRRRHYGMAATLMILSGLLTCFIGITAIIKGIFFNSVATFPFYYSVRSRGVTLLVIGAVVLVVGIALLVHMHWARHAATAVAVISALANFVFLPFYPFWSVIVLAIDVIIIWELTHEERTPGRQYALAAPSVACGSRSCQSWRAQSRSAASRPGSGAMAVAPTITPGAREPLNAVASLGTWQKAPPIGKARTNDIGDCSRGICTVMTLITSGDRVSRYSAFSYAWAKVAPTPTRAVRASGSTVTWPMALRSTVPPRRRPRRRPND